MDRALPEYRQAFRDYGWRPTSTDPAKAAARLRRRPAAVRDAVVAGLDHWLELAREEGGEDWSGRTRVGERRGNPARGENAAEVVWLGRVLAAADPDDWRQRLRVARGRRDREKLRELARQVKPANQRPQSLLLLARGLRASGAHEDRVELLRRSQQAHPGDFWINQQLGRALQDGQPPRLDQAIRFLTAAVALRPGSAGPRLDLGAALEEGGLRDEAIAVYRQALDLKPDYAQAHHNLVYALIRQGGAGHAVAAYRKTTQQQPTSALAHEMLGIALLVQRDRSGAAASFRRALEIDPKSARAHHGLGNALAHQGDLPGAIANLRRAVALNPKGAVAHHNLGSALRQHGDLPGAAASYRKTIQLKPDYADAYCNLGDVLLRQGDPRAALAPYQKGHDLGSRQKGWQLPSALWVSRCKRFIELEGRLPAILAGEAQPADTAERLDLAELCGYKGLHVSTARFYTEASADAKLPDGPHAGRRYVAACAAAQAGCGQGQEAARLDEAARARLRRQALGWLRADLAWTDGQLKGGNPQLRPLLEVMLRGWQSNRALAGVRDAGPLAALPPAERAEWRRLWVAVAATRALARDGK
jgi:Flp pilus assembly protein TadD